MLLLLLLLPLGRVVPSRRPRLRRRRTLLVAALLVAALRVATLLAISLRRRLLPLPLLSLLLQLVALLSILATSALSTVGHGHDVGSLVEGLVEVADGADDVLVAGDGERDHGL